ncbi:3-hydroxyisobutyryl-CoA hydrolase 1-like isoform X1 [Zingiber officinale]|uniref:3-hydroxyisobutyryl-CoA hydrolase 1-like isoform X1 n=1 Tax=Zingiber officinale TaxID=94328 RepID=UPI001C4D9CBC|nr:3-hydroxyisobutyryl-CoA hydrolase 1-like isoform X1 [Zingiber officinale]XP_042375938.1 3-hydroxyisobutyryl-CoA hydrolase 1-like isoform X1 [Zingiber officinale]
MASSHSNNDGTDQVLIQEYGSTRVLTLNRPRQLNALSFPMIMELLKKFVAYEKDPNVKLLILKGKGRAFCAGGDVAAVAHSVIEGNWTLGAHFFWNEFILNYLIATYRKPQVSILDGIVMGGGAGLSIHGRFRVATEKAIFAMPETSLGLFPDIGASYFLSRLPGSFGEYVGLTGARLDGPEMLACGLATHFVPSMKLALLEEALAKVDTSDHFSICSVIDRFSNNVPVKESSAFKSLDVIDKCFSKETVEEILSSLELEAVNAADEWIKGAIQSLKKASPMSLKITLRAIREGRTQGIGQCLIKDYRLCCHILRKEASKDFFEGCRALLVVKDKNPKWEPSRLDLVDDKAVDNCFSAVDDANWEDLRLPARPGLSFKYGSKL